MKYLILILVAIISCTSINSRSGQDSSGTQSIYNNELFRNDAVQIARDYLEKKGEMFEFYHEPVKITEEALYYFIYFKRKQNVRPQQIVLKVNKKNRMVEKVTNL